MLVNKWRYPLFTLIFLLVLTLVGCNEEEVSQSKKKSDPIEIVKLGEKTVISVTVSIIGESMDDIENPHVSYNQHNSIELRTFVDAIQKAEKVGGVVKAPVPNYLLILTFEDETTSEFLLWIKNDRGFIMNETDSHTMYTLPSELIVDLNRYVK